MVSSPYASGARPLPVTTGRLWAGGAAASVVAGLVALIGVLLGEGVLDLDMVRPPLLPVGDRFAVQYAVTAAALGLLATAVGHALLVTTPRPRAFFRWIVGLATTVGVLLPLAADGTLGGRLATALLDLVIGVCLLSLLSPLLALAAGRPRTAQPGARPGPPPVTG